MSNVQRNRPTVPPFKPLPPGATRPLAQQPERQRLIVQQNNTALSSSILSKPQALMNGASFTSLQEDVLKQRAQNEVKLREQQRFQQELLAMQVLKQQRQQQQEAMKLQRQHQQVKFPQQALSMATKRIQVN